jgi:hypothetical protein
LIVVMVGRPDGELGQTMHRDAAEAMAYGRKLASFSVTQESHRRGVFYVLSHGASYGGGQKAHSIFVLLIRLLIPFLSRHLETFAIVQRITKPS